MNVKTNKKCVCVGETECIKNVHGKILQNYIYIQITYRPGTAHVQIHGWLVVVVEYNIVRIVRRSYGGGRHDE